MCLELKHWQRALLVCIVVSAVPMFFLEALFLSTGVSFSWLGMLYRWIFVIFVLLLSQIGKPAPLVDTKWILPWFGVSIVAIGAALWVAYWISGVTSISWAALCAFYVVFLWLGTTFTSGQSRLRRWGIISALALLSSALIILIVEIESHFADEEFFVLFQGFALALFAGLLFLADRFFERSEFVAKSRGISFDSRSVGVAAVLFGIASFAFGVQSYQHSFYPTQAPKYQGITAENPFACGQFSQAKETFDGNDVFHRLLSKVQANPKKGVPEYGMLALGSGEKRWAEVFRITILDEAAHQLFTGPANSIKSIQYEAALRAYYYPRVRASYPSLFTSNEETILREWFAAINRRAVTTEWVDWMYAAAFAKMPEGPYENQDNGAGLLAVLESSGLAAPEVSPINREYLARNQRGWATRFRNTDDAFVYQPEWITNAFFESLYKNQYSQKNLRLAFEWMLLQTLPDGGSPGYNYPSFISLAGIAYLGARLIGDERYVWISGKALANDEEEGRYLFAQPGVEQAVTLLGRAPTEGSCLLYGDSGLPNQTGPLAPDKIVFRDGWSNDGLYALMNLRFTGWHRYKATNSITLIDQNGRLVGEETEGAIFTWLPAGRALFRDKRVPRENMNGLLIKREGIGAALYELTGLGSLWAQDPPYYANVERFETGPDKDVSVTVMEDWHGWRETRTAYFYHGGPLVVYDDARGPASQAAFVWHLMANGENKDGRVQLRVGEHPAQVVFLPIGKGEIQPLTQNESPLKDIMYTSRLNGKISLVTLFLTGEWFGAEASLVQTSHGTSLRITRGGDQKIDIALQSNFQ